MKNYESALKHEGYRKASRSHQDIKYIEECLGNDVLFYNKFISSGYTDWYSYYSMLVHEFYLIMDGEDVKVFVWRNGGPYRVEFKTEAMAIECLTFVETVPTKQIDALTIEFKHMSTDVIEFISTIK